MFKILAKRVFLLQCILPLPPSLLSLLLLIRMMIGLTTYRPVTNTFFFQYFWHCVYVSLYEKTLLTHAIFNICLSYGNVKNNTNEHWIGSLKRNNKKTYISMMIGLCNIFELLLFSNFNRIKIYHC